MDVGEVLKKLPRVFARRLERSPKIPLNTLSEEYLRFRVFHADANMARQKPAAEHLIKLAELAEDMHMLESDAT